MRRLARSLVLSVIGGTTLALAGVGMVAAAPAPQANCVATLTSFFGPQGLVDDAAHIIQQQAAQLGVPPGALASSVAKTRGSFADCLALVD
jgi:hypothetical protein